MNGSEQYSEVVPFVRFLQKHLYLVKVVLYLCPRAFGTVTLFACQV